MFILKYALKSISRSLGRNMLIGMIVFIIATAACVAMSIQKAAETAATQSLKNMNISAQINIDRGYVYEKAKENKGSEDMNELMPEMMSLTKEYTLTLDDMEKYNELKKKDSNEPLIKDYYYNASISIDGDNIEKYDLTSSSTEETTSATEATTVEATKMTDPSGKEIEAPTMPATPQQEPQQMEKAGDFSLIGYSAYKAMEDFGEDDESVCKLTDGEMFKDNTSDYVCLVEDNLATRNSLKVGDKIKLKNPKNEDETYELEVVGIYKNSSSNTTAGGSDPSNTIITSYAVVKDIETKSDETNNGTSSTSSSSSSGSKDSAATTAATEATTASTSSGSSNSSSSDSDEDETVLNSQFTGTFVLQSVEDYNQFKDEVKNKAKADGLDEDLYIVTSNDIATFKAGLKPLENLKSFATTFLYLMLAIGAIVLIVISVISIRDRKYEIGALAAMGLKKLKLSMMFMIEVLTVTLVAILIGAIAGAAVSVPITNTLLSAQVAQQTTEDNNKIQTPGMPGGGGGNMERPEDGEVTGEVSYVTQVGFSVDIFVILKMLAIGVGLAIVSGFTSIAFILRYDPKQILANRD